MCVQFHNDRTEQKRKVSRLRDLISGGLAPCLSHCMFYFDFDNTITTFDVLDDIIKHFSINEDWVAIENAWKAGEIGSQECLANQLKGVRVTKNDLLRYLSTVTIDTHFPELLGMLKDAGGKPVILSDSFSFIIQGILWNNGVRGVRVYSNTVRFDRDRLIPSFPHTNSDCTRCAHCKKRNLLNHSSKGKITVYIGDGLSDICPAYYADMVFAKASLLRHIRNTGRYCIPFRDLGDIVNYLQGVTYESGKEREQKASKISKR
jgi:2-hydroxy-3-keto-5-methylthiopentenyl-1-phosphate phosphatase